MEASEIADSRLPSQSASAERSVAVALLLAALAAIPALVAYYVILSAWAVFMAASAFLAAPSEEALPAYLNYASPVLVYGGLTFAAAVALVAYRLVRPDRTRSVRTWLADAIIVMGAGLFGAVVGLWPALILFATPDSTVSAKGVTVCGAVGFLMGIAASVALLGVSAATKRCTASLHAAT